MVTKFFGYPSVRFATGWLIAMLTLSVLQAFTANILGLDSIMYVFLGVPLFEIPVGNFSILVSLGLPLILTVTGLNSDIWGVLISLVLPVVLCAAASRYYKNLALRKSTDRLCPVPVRDNLMHTFVWCRVMTLYWSLFNLLPLIAVGTGTSIGVLLKVILDVFLGKYQIPDWVPIIGGVSTSSFITAVVTVILSLVLMLLWSPLVGTVTKHHRATLLEVDP